MKNVCVRVHLAAPLERVFDAVSDHECFLCGGQADTVTTITRAGTPERNGLGCLREVKFGSRATYLEEITGWHRPDFFEYMIRESSLPLRHAGSRLTFTARGGGTDVEWTSQFTITVPILAPLLGAYAQRLYAKGFESMLLAAKERLETTL